MTRHRLGPAATPHVCTSACMQDARILPYRGCFTVYRHEEPRMRRPIRSKQRDLFAAPATAPVFPASAAAPEGPDVFVLPHEIGIAPADGSCGGLAATVAHIGFADSIVKVELRVGDARRTLDVVLQKLEYRHLALKVNQRVVIYLRDRQLAGRVVVQASPRGL